MLMGLRQAGFSLVELMVALVAGLIVSGAVIAFIGATIEANNETLRAVRLSQELRSLAEVISREVKRARSVADPFQNIGSGCDANGTTAATTDDCSGLAIVRSVDTATAGCIRFGYEGATGGSFRAIRRAVVGGVGTVVISRGTQADTECGDPGTTVSSAQVDITGLTFERPDIDPGAAVVPHPSQVDITLRGRLRNGPAGPQFEKTYQTSVFIRSGRY